MGYPLWIDNVEIISKFHKNHIYQARFWEYMVDRNQKETLEYHLTKYMALICIWKSRSRFSGSGYKRMY